MSFEQGIWDNDRITLVLRQDVGNSIETRAALHNPDL